MKRVMCIWFPNWRAERERIAGPECDDRAALTHLAQGAERFSPTVGLADPAWTADETADSLLCDVTGCAQLFGDEAALVAQTTAAFAERGLTVRAAVADTVGAAWAMVRGTTDHQLPATSLPVTALRLPGATLETLARLGIHRVDQLERLPRASLAARCGAQVLQRLDQATGRQAEVIVPERPLVTPTVDWAFEPPTENAEALRGTLAHLVEMLTRQLRGQDLGVERLECWLRLERGQPLLAAIDLYRPTAKARHLTELLELQLAHLRPTAPVQTLELVAVRTAPCPAEQTEMFAGGSAPEAEALATLVDRLASRLGRGAVLTPRLSPEVQPERAVEYDSALERRRPQRGSSPATWPQRPLRLQGPPLAITVQTSPTGYPVAFTWRGSEHRLARVWGPERIETGWWRDAPIRRDYYRVDTVNGCRFWLFRRMSDGAWFLHGWFE